MAFSLGEFLPLPAHLIEKMASDILLQAAIRFSAAGLICHSLRVSDGYPRKKGSSLCPDLHWDTCGLYQSPAGISTLHFAHCWRRIHHVGFNNPMASANSARMEEVPLRACTNLTDGDLTGRV